METRDGHVSTQSSSPDDSLRSVLNNLRIGVSATAEEEQNTAAPPTLPLVDQIRLISAHIDSLRADIAKEAFENDGVEKVTRQTKDGLRIRSELSRLSAQVTKLDSHGEDDDDDDIETGKLYSEISRRLSALVQLQRTVERERQITKVGQSLIDTVASLEELESLLASGQRSAADLVGSLGETEARCALLGIKGSSSGGKSVGDIEWLNDAASQPPLIRELDKRVTGARRRVDQALEDAWNDFCCLDVARDDAIAITVGPSARVQIDGVHFEFTLADLIVTLQARSRLLPLVQMLSANIVSGIVKPVLTTQAAKWNLQHAESSLLFSANPSADANEASVGILAVLDLLKQHFFRLVPEMQGFSSLQFEFSRHFVPVVIPMLTTHLKSLLPTKLTRPVGVELSTSLQAVSGLANEWLSFLHAEGYMTGGLEEEGEPLSDLGQHIGKYFMRQVANFSRLQCRDLLLKEMSGGWEGITVELEVEVEIPTIAQPQQVSPPLSKTFTDSSEQSSTHKDDDEDDWAAWDDANSTSQVPASTASKPKSKKSLGWVRVVKPHDQLGSGPFPGEDDPDEISWGFDDDDEGIQTPVAASSRASHLEAPFGRVLEIKEASKSSEARKQIVAPNDSEAFGWGFDDDEADAFPVDEHNANDIGSAPEEANWGFDDEARPSAQPSQPAISDPKVGSITHGLDEDATKKPAKFLADLVEQRDPISRAPLRSDGPAPVEMPDEGGWGFDDDDGVPFEPETNVPQASLASTAPVASPLPAAKPETAILPAQAEYPASPSQSLSPSFSNTVQPNSSIIDTDSRRKDLSKVLDNVSDAQDNETAVLHRANAPPKENEAEELHADGWGFDDIEEGVITPFGQDMENLAAIPGHENVAAVSEKARSTEVEAETSQHTALLSGTEMYPTLSSAHEDTLDVSSVTKNPIQASESRSGLPASPIANIASLTSSSLFEEDAEYEYKDDGWNFEDEYNPLVNSAEPSQSAAARTDVEAIVMSNHFVGSKNDSEFSHERMTNLAAEGAETSPVSNSVQSFGAAHRQEDLVQDEENDAGRPFLVSQPSRSEQMPRHKEEDATARAQSDVSPLSPHPFEADERIGVSHEQDEDGWKFDEEAEEDLNLAVEHKLPQSLQMPPPFFGRSAPSADVPETLAKPIEVSEHAPEHAERDLAARSTESSLSFARQPQIPEDVVSAQVSEQPMDYDAERIASESENADPSSARAPLDLLPKQSDQGRVDGTNLGENAALEADSVISRNTEPLGITDVTLDAQDGWAFEDEDDIDLAKEQVTDMKSASTVQASFSQSDAPPDEGAVPAQEISNAFSGSDPSGIQSSERKGKELVKDDDIAPDALSHSKLKDKRSDAHQADSGWNLGESATSEGESFKLRTTSVLFPAPPPALAQWPFDAESLSEAGMEEEPSLSEDQSVPTDQAKEAFSLSADQQEPADHMSESDSLPVSQSVSAEGNKGATLDATPFVSAFGEADFQEQDALDGFTSDPSFEKAAENQHDLIGRIQAERASEGEELVAGPMEGASESVTNLKETAIPPASGEDSMEAHDARISEDRSLLTPIVKAGMSNPLPSDLPGANQMEGKARDESNSSCFFDDEQPSSSSKSASLMSQVSMEVADSNALNSEKEIESDGFVEQPEDVLHSTVPATTRQAEPNLLSAATIGLPGSAEHDSLRKGSDASWNSEEDDVGKAPRSVFAGSKTQNQAKVADTMNWGFDDEADVDSSSIVTPSTIAQPSSKVTKEACIVSQRSIEYVKLAWSMLDDILAVLDAGEAVREANLDVKYLVEALNDILDLHRALMPVGHAETLNNVPTLAAQFVNDCVYIARELVKMDKAWQAARAKSPAGTDDVLQLEHHAQLTNLLGQRSFDAQLIVQQRILAECLADTNNFEATFDEVRAQNCERAMRQVLVVIEQLSKAWKPVLTRSYYLVAMGRLVDSVLRRILYDVTALQDISEVEGEKLSELVKSLSSLEDLFRPSPDSEQSDVAIYVSSWFKMSYLSDILTGSLVDIEFLYFEAGALVDYSKDELTKLIRALFSDTPKRTRLIDRIQSA